VGYERFRKKDTALGSCGERADLCREDGRAKFRG
jgi:hypothetical protein